MSAGLVDQIKGVKDRINGVKDRVLFLLEAIKAGQDRLLTDQECFNSEQERFVAEQEKLIKETADARLQIDNLSQQINVLGDTLKHQLAEYERLASPRNDPYSYPEEFDRLRRANPELALLQYLRSFLISSNVLDIGANHGDGTEPLLSAGYRIYAFEPLPSAYEKLCQRLNGAVGFKAFPVAIGHQDSNTLLYPLTIADENLRRSYDEDLTMYSSLVQHALPDGLTFANPVDVKMRSLKSLHDSGELPGDISIVKIDTEGGDLNVIKGMGNAKYAMVMTKFWDAEYVFSDGEHGLLSQTVLHLRNRGYPWHIIVYRTFDGRSNSEPRFYCNLDQSVKSSWGNAIFFRDYDVFREALKWCTAMLPANNSYGP